MLAGKRKALRKEEKSRKKRNEKAKGKARYSGSGSGKSRPLPGDVGGSSTTEAAARLRGDGCGHTTFVGLSLFRK